MTWNFSGAERFTSWLVSPTALLSLAPRVVEGLSSTFGSLNILRPGRIPRSTGNIQLGRCFLQLQSNHLGYRKSDYTYSIAQMYAFLRYKALRKESILTWNPVELKLTSLCSAGEYTGKPLYPKAKAVGFYGLFP
jgi:hypothetical protein